MILRLGFVALAALCLVPTSSVSAFSTAPTSLARESLAFVTDPKAAGNQKGAFGVVGNVPSRARAVSRVTSSSVLSMGKLEEFVTGRDDKQRKAENEKYLAELQKRVDRINGLEADIEELGDDELQAKTKEFQERLKSGEDINGPLLEEAFAVVREAAW